MSLIQKFRVLPRIHKRTLVFGMEGRSGSSVYLGKLAEELTNTDVWVDIQKEHVTAIVGKRGSGKSYTMGCLAEGLATNDPLIHKRNGEEKGRAALLFDTINIFWTMNFLPEEQRFSEIVKQKELLKAWGLKPSKVKVDIWIPAGFEIQGTKYRTFTINVAELDAADWCFLLGYDMVRDLGGQLIMETVDKMNVEWTWVQKDDNDNITKRMQMRPKTNFEVSDLITCIQHDEEISSRTEDYSVQTRRAAINGLRVLARYPLFSQTGTNLRDLLKNEQLTILLLGTVPNDIRAAIVSVVVKKLLSIRATTSYFEKRKVIEKEAKPEPMEKTIPRVTLFFDEAQNLMPSTMKTMFNQIMVKLVREGRNFGISIILTTQQPTAIDTRVMSQVDTLISHRLTAHNDITYVIQNQKTALPEETGYKGRHVSYENLLRSLPTGYAIVSNTDTERAFVLTVRPRVTVHGGFEL